MLRLSTEQRRLLADKLCDAGNVAAGALIFGQFLGDAQYSIPLGLLDVAVWLSFGTLAVMLTQENSR